MTMPTLLTFLLAIKLARGALFVQNIAVAELQI